MAEVFEHQAAQGCRDCPRVYRLPKGFGIYWKGLHIGYGTTSGLAWGSVGLAGYCLARGAAFRQINIHAAAAAQSLGVCERHEWARSPITWTVALPDWFGPGLRAAEVALVAGAAARAAAAALRVSRLAVGPLPVGWTAALAVGLLAASRIAIRSLACVLTLTSCLGLLGAAPGLDQALCAFSGLLCSFLDGASLGDLAARFG